MEQTYRWSLRDIIVTVLVSAGLGVLWFGWTQFYEFAKGPLSAIHPGLKHILGGFWFTGGTIIPAIIRKPGSAVIGETLAAAIEGLITQWGITATIWGLLQGLGSELGFAVFRYKRWDVIPFILAGALAGLVSWILEFFYENYLSLTVDVWVVQILMSLIGGIVLAGLLGYYLVEALRKAKVIA
jgi:energy-coupling factor transport system substrate-specific component